MSLTVQTAGGGGLIIKNGVSKKVKSLGSIDASSLVSIPFGGVIDNNGKLTDSSSYHFSKIGKANNANSEGNFVYLLQVQETYIRAVEVSTDGVVLSVGEKFYNPYCYGNNAFWPIGGNKFYTSGYTGSNNTTYEFVLEVNLDTLEITEVSKTQIGTGNSVTSYAVTVDRNTLLCVNTINKIFSVDYNESTDSVSIGVTVPYKTIGNMVVHGGITRISKYIYLMKYDSYSSGKYTSYMQAFDLNKNKLGAMLTKSNLYSSDMYGSPILNGYNLVALQSYASPPVNVGKGEINLSTLDISYFNLQTDKTYNIKSGFKFVKGIITLDKYVVDFEDESPNFTLINCATPGDLYNGETMGSYCMSWDCYDRSFKVNPLIFDEVEQSSNKGQIVIGVSEGSADSGEILNISVSGNAAYRIPNQNSIQ